MHLLTIVIGDDPEGQLERYLENNLGTCPEKYLEFYDVEEEYQERYATGIFDSAEDKANHPERYLKFFREVFPTFDDYMTEAYGPRDEKTGRYGDWWNPNSQFDWCAVGGRFAGHLILRAGPAGPRRADEAAKGEVDFPAMARERYRELMSDWDRLERAGKTTDRRERGWLNLPDAVTTRGQFDAYAQTRARHAAPSVVVHNGEWSGPWWLSDEPVEVAAAKWDAWYSALVASLADDTLLTVFDCHVV